MKYQALVTEARRYWSDVANKNGWILKQGVTVWVDSGGNMIDSCYNEPDSFGSYIVDYETERMIASIPPL